MADAVDFEAIKQVRQIRSEGDVMARVDRRGERAMVADAEHLEVVAVRA